jgi:hypothetical protein
VGSPIPPESLHACRSPDFDQGESRELLVRLAASRKHWMILCIQTGTDFSHLDNRCVSGGGENSQSSGLDSAVKSRLQIA